MGKNPQRPERKEPIERPHWLDRPGSVRLLIMLLGLGCLLVLGLDFVVHRHVEFAFEAWYGFYAIYGFLAYCVIVLSAKQLRKLLRRDEDYYGE